MGRVPTICLSGLSETQRRACIIADNQLALNAGWDAELLKIELAEGLTDPDDAPAAPEHPVSEPGDLWILERHRLLCARWREWCSDPHRRGWRGGAAVALLLVHCRAGVSRSTAAAALILMQANPEWPASAALDAVAAIRPRAWPNLLILEFGDALLGRNGELATAAGAIYRRVLARDPEFGDQMIDAGRDREVSAAYRETG